MFTKHNPIEIAKLESALAGILAGFALTIVVLLLEQQVTKKNSKFWDKEYGKATILVFIDAFFTGILAAFLYAITAGEMDSTCNRLYVSLLLPSFIFVLTGVLVALGLIFLLDAYKSDFAAQIAFWVLLGTIFASISNYASACLDAISRMNDIQISQITRYPVILSGISLLLCIIIGSIMRFFNKNKSFSLKKLKLFIISTILFCAIIGTIAPIVHHAPSDMKIANLPIYISIFILTILCGWAISYLPKIRTER